MSTWRVHLPPVLARPWVRRLTALFAVAVVGGAAAAPIITPAASVGRLTEDAAEALQEAAPAFELREVMGPGADVDGDGAADFVNPTGSTARATDGFGSGAFHASRDGGARAHAGVDYLARAGQTVAAPISGYVTRIGYAYGDDTRLRYVELSNAAIGYVVRVFYLDPSVALGETVRLGRPIGTALTLQDRYPGISDHVHLETSRIGRGQVDPTALIPVPIFRLARTRGRPGGAG